MTQIRAFVGHSFTPGDGAVVTTFLTFFDQMKGALPDFDWVNAKAAEPTELAAKVLKLVDGRNAFIGICTRKERVVADEKLRATLFDRGRKSVADADLEWKTSDWIIQEIGLAIGRNMAIILLVENGCRKPGGLQGDVEFIPFDRSAPERAFGRLLEMMKALSPRPSAGEVTSADSTTETTGEELEAPSTQDDDTPDETWSRERYENAFFWKLINRDTEGAKKIDVAFTASKHSVDQEALAAWKATTELWRIRFGEEGSLDRLREYQQSFSANSEISTTLASGFATLGMHSEAAEQYLSAASLVSEDRVERERLRGLAAVQLTKAGDKVRVEELLKEQRATLKSGVRKEELNYLFRSKEILADTDNKYGEIEILERIVQLVPDDWDSRFNLAYKYSQAKMNDMSLYHYSQIPYSQRSAITWNNLGVDYQQHSMPAKAVDAYRTAASKGETLAMSNLAYKLMQGGFVTEAEKELQRALKVEDFHRNVGEAVSALKDIPEEEEKKLKEQLKRAEPKRQFFQGLGEAITFPDIGALQERWTGPDCEFAVTIRGDELHAYGEYERISNALSGLLSSGQKTTRYKLAYKGNIRGRRVIGTFTKKSEGGVQSAGLLALAGDGEDIEFAMLINPDKGAISVAERQSSATPRFYTLRAAVGAPAIA